MSLLEHWHPVTSDMGLINARSAPILTSLVSSRTSRLQCEIPSSLEGALSTLPPLSVEMKRQLLVPTTGEWTAYFASGIQGSDPSRLMSSLAMELGVIAMRVCSTPSTQRFPATIWEVYAPEALGGSPPLGYRRSIAAANDGGRWVFEQSGEPFPFEDLSAYQAKRKRDRFNRELLQSYLREFQLDPFNESFYAISRSSPALLLARTLGWERAPEEFTLTEVCQGVPWQR